MSTLFHSLYHLLHSITDSVYYIIWLHIPLVPISSCSLVRGKHSEVSLVQAYGMKVHGYCILFEGVLTGWMINSIGKSINEEDSIAGGMQWTSRLLEWTTTGQQLDCHKMPHSKGQHTYSLSYFAQIAPWPFTTSQSKLIQLVSQRPY